MFLDNKNLNNEKMDKNNKKIMKKEEKNNFPPKKKKNIKFIDINNHIKKMNFKDNNSSSFGELQFSKKSLINKNNKNICSESLKSSSRNKDKNYIKENEKNLKNIDPILNDQEMNSLEYNKAIKIDKRGYFEYYFSLLKRKQLLLFSFFPNNDYNL